MNNYGCAYVWGKMCDAYIIAFLDLWSVYLCYAFYLWYLYLWSYYLWAVYLCVVPLLVKPLLVLPWLVVPLLAMPLLVKLLLVKRLLVWYLYLCETFSCVMFLLVTCLLWSFYSFAHVNFTLDTLSSNLSLEVWLHLDTCVRKSIYSSLIFSCFSGSTSIGMCVCDLCDTAMVTKTVEVEQQQPRVYMRNVDYQAKKSDAWNLRLETLLWLLNVWMLNSIMGLHAKKGFYKNNL